ncbi:Peroxidase 1 [Apostasia shenzhenica]|uniref:Peroxidase n=1 Tax=Apostasia shenzhenica TaxID=1088818 RepID=A0A2I0ADA7_9ASPA|nr:Peroxidase 1 [Apostasia shenzhenica]
MPSHGFFRLPLSLPVLLLLVLHLKLSADALGLKIGFYDETCPQAEVIVFKEMERVLNVAPSLAGPLLRMHFHDCFVRGCDGSILLNATRSSGPVEKDGLPNLSLRGYGVIDGVKSKLEKACPGIISCADILALVARDVVLLSKGPFWRVLTGRRDGRQSSAQETLTNLPPPTSNISQLLNAFAKKGLDAKDLVVLLGSHTIGTSHCSSFSDRLYNFNKTGKSDPSLDKNYLQKLKSKCRPNDVKTLVEMDPGSFRTFDSSYYKLIVKRRALFNSDEALLHDEETKDYVHRQVAVAVAVAARGFPAEFFKDYGVSMVKMGNIEVLTGSEGEIRKKCAFVN